MTIGPLFGVGAALVGCVFGAIGGAQHSPTWAAIGCCSGLLLGIGSFSVLTVPYVGWIVRYEKQHPGFKEPPRVWGWLFLPLMIGSLFAAGISSWFVVKLLVRWIAA